MRLGTPFLKPFFEGYVQEKEELYPGIEARYPFLIDNLSKKNDRSHTTSYPILLTRRIRPFYGLQSRSLSSHVLKHE